MDNVKHLADYMAPGTYWEIVHPQPECGQYDLYVAGKNRMSILSTTLGHILYDGDHGKYIDGDFPSLASAAIVAETLAGLEIE